MRPLDNGRPHVEVVIGEAYYCPNCGQRRPPINRVGNRDAVCMLCSKLYIIDFVQITFDDLINNKADD